MNIFELEMFDIRYQIYQIDSMVNFPSKKVMWPVREMPWFLNKDPIFGPAGDPFDPRKKWWWSSFFVRGFVRCFSQNVGLVFPSFALYWKLGGGFKYFLFSPRILGEMIQFDVRIFFKWVGSTTNQFFHIFPFYLNTFLFEFSLEDDFMVR